MKLIEFLKRPRNLYLSIVTMLIVVFGLSSITFSYYIEDSSDSDQVMKVSSINTVIQTDDLESDTVDLLPQEERVIHINVISKNEYPNEFKIYYTGEDVTVTSNKEIPNVIDTNETLSYEITIKNNKDEYNFIQLGIKNGYIGSELEIEGTQIK